MNILIIEDDPLVTRSLGMILQAAGLAHKAADTGKRGIELARAFRYDAILLDLTLPDLDGREVLRRLRLALIDTPVIILTGDSDIQSKVQGFDLGADDYVTKPFERDELLARIQAVIRRSFGAANSVVTTGLVTTDLVARTTDVNGVRIHMAPTEYAILELLTLHKGTPLSKEAILSHVYAGRGEAEIRIIDVYVCKIRRKFAEAGADPSGYIETVYGLGYVLRDPEVELPEQAQAA